MPFGADLALLDAYQEVEQYGKDGHDQVSRLVDYLKRRMIILEEYQKGLAKLNSVFLSSFKQQSLDRSNKNSSRVADSPLGYNSTEHDLNKLLYPFLLATQESTVDCLRSVLDVYRSTIYPSTKDTLREHSRFYKDLITDANALRQTHRQLLRQHQVQKKATEAALKAAEDAKVTYERLDGDMNATKAQVEKAREDFKQKMKKSLMAKEEFSEAKVKMEELTKRHYEEDLTPAFDRLQGLEEHRLIRMKMHIKELTLQLLETAQAEVRALQQVISSLDSFSPREHIQVYVDHVRAQLVAEGRKTGTDPNLTDISMDASPITGDESLANLPVLERTLSRLSLASMEALASEDINRIKERLQALNSEKSIVERQLEALRQLNLLYNGGGINNESNDDLNNIISTSSALPGSLLCDELTRIETTRQLKKAQERYLELSAELEKLDIALRERLGENSEIALVANGIQSDKQKYAEHIPISHNLTEMIINDESSPTQLMNTATESKIKKLVDDHMPRNVTDESVSAIKANDSYIDSEDGFMENDSRVNFQRRRVIVGNQSSNEFKDRTRASKFQIKQIY